MRRYFAFARFGQARSQTRGSNALMVAGLMFALGLASGALLPPVARGVPVVAAVAAIPEGNSKPADVLVAQPVSPAMAYPAEVLRVIDGDTFEARVRVWPGLDVDTKVRLRGIDAAELHARCPDELAKAQAARSALETILAGGGVAVSRVGFDKYGGRVDATVSTRATADVSAELLNGGYARGYYGGKRGSWCG